MKILSKIIVAFAMLVNVYGWEINTHRAIDREAIGLSENLKRSLADIGMDLSSIYKGDAIVYEGYGTNYLRYIIDGEKNGVSKWGQEFIYVKNNDNDINKKIATVQDLIEAGTILEDAQWPHGWIIEHIGLWDQADGRFNNHFADPQEGYKGLWIGKRMDALHWA